MNVEEFLEEYNGSPVDLEELCGIINTQLDEDPQDEHTTMLIETMKLP
jgi:hypothetical protein